MFAAMPVRNYSQDVRPSLLRAQSGLLILINVLSSLTRDLSTVSAGTKAGAVRD